MNAFKEQCVALRRKDYSIIEIMKATGRAKSSVHTHIRNMPLSAERIARYRADAGKRIRKFAVARKGRSVRPFRTFETWSANSVLLVSHLLFDGKIAQSSCCYNNRSKALIERVRILMQELYDFEPKWYRNPLTGVRRISYHNVALSAYLHNKSEELLQKVMALPLDLKHEFIRAFFDDEGCIDYRPNANRRSVRGYQKDVRTLETIKSLLADFNIPARVVLPNEVVIVGKLNLMRFADEINFSPGVYMNGNRSNSRWKKHMEKRELLKHAIKSFKN
jgi:LAGLIDADG-like domain